MLRIRFGDGKVTVDYDLGEQGCHLEQDYKNVAVEFMHARRFWQAVEHPLGVLRLGQKAKEMGDLFVAIVRGEAKRGSQQE